MAYDNTMKIEFYKPKYNLDIKFDGDDSFDLLFKNVSGELFFSASVEDYDSYVSFEDEECKFTNGELVAKVDISDLMETIANGQLRNTNGTTYGEWIPRIVGDYKTEHDLVFDGKTYADRGYWELFFKEMSKDEIKDFIEFCRDYIDIPNLEFSFREFDFNNDNIVVNGKGYSITINDDLTIEMAEEFTCKSSDVVDVWVSNHDYGDEFEEKKSTKRNLKENRFDDIIRDVENLLLDDRVLKSIDGWEDYTELAYMLAERLDPSDFAMDEDSLAREIKDMLIRGKIKITESKKSVKKSLKESSNVKENIWVWQSLLNHMFNFTNWICRTFARGQDLHDVLERQFKNKEITLDEFVDASIKFMREDFFTDDLLNYIKEYLPNDEKIKKALKISGLSNKYSESKKSTKRSLTEGISAFNKAIAKKYNETEPNGAGQYYLDWRFDLHDEKDNIEAIADRYGVTVEFQTDEGYFEVFEESKNSTKKSLKEEAITTKLFRFIQDLYDVHYITEEQLNKFQKHDFSKKEIKVLEQNYEIYKTSNEFDEINNAIKSTVNMINSFKESLKESVEFYNDFGTGVYCATSSNGWTFCYCPLSWINKKGVEDLIGWSVMDDKAHYIDGDSWENKTDEEINDSIDNFEKLIKKYAKEDAKEIIKDFRSTLEK